MNYITYRDLGKNGRLGNQLFQVAATIGAAKKYNATPFLPPWEYEKYFQPFAGIGNLEPNYYYKEPHFHYKEIDWSGEDTLVKDPRNDGSKVLNLDGYFQSEKYFDHCRRLVLSMFQPSRLLLDDLRTVATKQLFSMAITTTCSIHVRRGDYVGNAFYKELGVKYYNDAIAYIDAHAKVQRFLIFSDDIEYCKSIFIGEQFVFVEGNTDIQDLFLMSFCDHNIGANSSFSWWAAYLNNSPEKIVIFPKEWFGPAASVDTKDLYTKNMIVL